MGAKVEKAQGAEFAKLGTVVAFQVATGPLLSLVSSLNAATQLHQTDHSFVSQHFRRMKVGSADKAGFRCAYTNVRLRCLVILKESHNGRPNCRGAS